LRTQASPDPGCRAGHQRVWRNILFAPSKASFRFSRSKLPYAVKNSPGVRQRMIICIAPRDRSVQRSIRLNHSIEIALTVVIPLMPFVKTLNGRKGRCWSAIPVRFPGFSRWSTSEGLTGTVLESKIYRTISEGRLITFASTCAACSWNFCEILGAAALCAAALLRDVLWPLLLDWLGNGLLVASDLVRFLERVRFLEVVRCNFFGFRIQLQTGQKEIVPHRTFFRGPPSERASPACL
jgi:hypothetical protein